MNAGETLNGRYQLRERISAGAMGEVWHAFDLRLEREVAIKAATATDGNPELLAEGRAAAMLDHPNIVAVHDAGTHEGEPFIVMEYIAGPSLRTHLHQRGSLPEARALRVASDILSALEYAHRRGVWHNDVKPENILLSPAGDARLADFGIASFNASTVDISSDGVRFATPAYAAPEVLAGGSSGPAADLYAAAMVIYDCLGGPVLGRTRPGNGSVPPLSKVAPGTSPAVGDVLSRALAPEPADRYASAAALRHAFEEAGVAMQPTRPLAPASAARATSSRWRPMLLGALLAGALGLGAASLWSAQPFGADGTPASDKADDTEDDAAGDVAAISNTGDGLVFYLQDTDDGPGETEIQAAMEMTAAPGPDVSLPNYGSENDDYPGRTLEADDRAPHQDDGAKYVRWRGAPGSLLDFEDGYDVTVTFWFAGSEWESGVRGTFDVQLRAQDSSGRTIASCSGTRDASSPGGENHWAPLQVAFTCANETGTVRSPATFELQITLADYDRSRGGDGMMIAYGTAVYGSQVRVDRADTDASPPRAAAPETDDEPAADDAPDTDDEPSPDGPPASSNDEQGEERVEDPAEDRGMLDRAWDGLTGFGRFLREGSERVLPW